MFNGVRHRCSIGNSPQDTEGVGSEVGKLSRPEPLDECEASVSLPIQFPLRDLCVHRGEWFVYLSWEDAGSSPVSDFQLRSAAGSHSFSRLFQSDFASLKTPL